MIKYSIIVCSFNRFSFLPETIEAILRMIGSRDNCEILIIDNNSTDLTSTLKNKFALSPTVKYHLEQQQGLSFARNRGIEEAKGELLVFLDDDIDVVPNYLEMCDRIFEDSSVGIAGGKVLPFEVQVPGWLPRKFYYLVSLFDLGNAARRVKHVMGGNCVIRKDVATLVGQYNTKLGRNGKNLMGGEEIEYFNRAHALGISIWYYPALTIYHKIASKLNRDYVFDYSIQNGKSDRIIDFESNKMRYYLKVIKSILMLLANGLFGFYLPVEKTRVFFKISSLYSRGYLMKSY